MKITKEQLKKIISEEMENIQTEAPGGEDIREGLMDDPDCARVARRKYDEYGGSPFEYYDRCMDARKSSGGGSSPSYASTGWARKSSLDHMSDIGRFEEGKIKKRDLVAIIREEITNTLKRTSK